MAFGTGTHPTTVMCLQALEKYVQEGDTVVDVGTGSGVLSIGAALLGASRVHALDLDDVAVVAARENIKLNHVDGKVDVMHGNLLDSVKEPADIIIANILAEVIMTFSAGCICDFTGRWSVHRLGHYWSKTGFSERRPDCKGIRNCRVCTYGRLGCHCRSKKGRVTFCNAIFFQSHLIWKGTLLFPERTENILSVSCGWQSVTM